MNQPVNRARNLSAGDILGTGDDVFTGVGLDPRGNNELNTILQRIGAANYRGAASRTAFNLGQESNLQNAVANLIASLGQKNYGQMATRAKGALRSGYAQAAGDADAQARSMGLGEGFRSGQLSAGGQQLARGLGGVDAYYSDPARREQDLMQIIQVLGPMLADNPYLAQILGINPQTEANAQYRDQMSRQGGIGGILGQAIGLGLSGGFGGAVGGARAVPVDARAMAGALGRAF